MLIPRLHHHQSIMARSPNDGLYNNLYDKDVGLMRKLMNLDEFQCPGNVTHPNNNPNCIGNEMNASKQFHQYPNGVFNGKFANPANFPFPFDKQPSTNGIRHEGLLKPCYEFPSKADGLDEAFGSSPIPVGGFKKQQQQQQQQQQLQQASLYTSSAFMNQFPHESLFGANNHHNSTFTKLNEINNNNGGGIVVKMENGVSANDFNTLHMNNKVNEHLCPRSSNALNKTEPNEFRNSCCKGNADSSHRDDEEQKSSALRDDSNDGFTQL